MKPWKVITLTTDCEQEIQINPTPEMEAIEFRYKETEDDLKFRQPLYLSKDTIDHLITSLQQMKEYVNLKD
jgi:hypothetical protein